MAKWESEGEYFRLINRIYKSLPQNVQERIHFMGSVPNAELQSVYQGADMLVNLSVHNDEDYGMSVAEAQCSGLPTILTDWGGLASFRYEDMPEAAIFIPVQIGKRAKLIHYDSVVDAFYNTWKNEPKVNRAALSEKAIQKFGVARTERILKEIVQKEPSEFTKFTPFFDKVLSASVFSQTPYMDEARNINQLYREIYSSYVRNT
jgi:glycosyltransferase involved in cell wall biosynthesis